MMRMICAVALVAAVAGVCVVGSVRGEETKQPAVKGEVVKSEALNFKVKDIDGKEVDLNDYAGKVVMIVNVASKCGNTKQYTGLEEMYQKYKDKGFVILAFPANNFGKQEPGTEAEIKEFCTNSAYKVTFPLFSKISVKGEDMAPLYKYLTQTEAKPKGKGDVGWNFEKFLIGKDGKVVGRFEAKTKPDNKELVAAVEAALK
jgi:glutathione peroxidase